MARAQCLCWWTMDDELLRRLSNGLQGLRRVGHHHVRVGAATHTQFTTRVTLILPYKTLP